MEERIATARSNTFEDAWYSPELVSIDTGQIRNKKGYCMYNVRTTGLPADQKYIEESNKLIEPFMDYLLEYMEKQWKNKEVAYECGGDPKCFRNEGCGLCGKGDCYETTDINYAKNRFTILNNEAYCHKHFLRLMDNKYVEL